MEREKYMKKTDNMGYTTGVVLQLTYLKQFKSDWPDPYLDQVTKVLIDLDYTTKDKLNLVVEVGIQKYKPNLSSLLHSCML